MNQSFPVRERGLKPVVHHITFLRCPVVPCAGTWIETKKENADKQVQAIVVPCAGTWIETL